MGISLKIPFGSRRRPSKPSAGQKPSGEGSSRKQAQDHRSGGPPSPYHIRQIEPRPKPYIVQSRTPTYNVREVRPSTAPQKPHVTVQTITTTTPSSHRHRRRSSVSIRSPPHTSYSYVEPNTRNSPVRHCRRSSRPKTPNSPVSPLETSRFEFPSPWSQPQPVIQRDEYGFSIRTPSTPVGQGNAYGMSALAPVNSGEFSYFEPWAGGQGMEGSGEEKGGSGWTEEDLMGYYSYGVGSVGTAGGGIAQSGRSRQHGRGEQSGRETRGEGSRVRFA
ncbi:hypothetical protein COCMIDRAFT_87018 [Bipolaris oryzae ATCC 44560]|uniref:Uncharacterized protein n=1 Tax=Bipolaris oryzae ATCC 44560 TaxID=930090 RepID=W6ZM01_COCMI|nr:uncharacterized protein COCMIDRAFT_87018 [Bipolaris oryzae ATCC 44560]EUC48569.1 hypothetical protein COCMIDRAFT_87018 [Bipolaris oryzae ATCC 44560]